MVCPAPQTSPQTIVFFITARQRQGDIVRDEARTDRGERRHRARPPAGRGWGAHRGPATTVTTGWDAPSQVDAADGAAPVVGVWAIALIPLAAPPGSELLAVIPVPEWADGGWPVPAGPLRHGPAPLRNGAAPPPAGTEPSARTVGRHRIRGSRHAEPASRRTGPRRLHWAELNLRRREPEWIATGHGPDRRFSADGTGRTGAGG